MHIYWHTGKQPLATKVGALQAHTPMPFEQSERVWMLHVSPSSMTGLHMALPLSVGDGMVIVGVPPSLHFLATSQRSVGGLDTLSAAIELKL